MRLLRGLTRRIGLTLFVAGLVLSPNTIDALKVLKLAGEGAIAEYRLRAIPPETYAREIEAALEAHDDDLARSLVALAEDQGVVVPAALLTRVAEVPHCSCTFPRWAAAFLQTPCRGRQGIVRHPKKLPRSNASWEDRMGRIYRQQSWG